MHCYQYGEGKGHTQYHNRNAYGEVRPNHMLDIYDNIIVIEKCNKANKGEKK